MSKLKFVFQGSQKRHVRVAISQKELVNFFRYAHQIEAFFSPVHAQVSLFLGRFSHAELHSAECSPAPAPSQLSLVIAAMYLEKGRKETDDVML